MTKLISLLLLALLTGCASTIRVGSSPTSEFATLHSQMDRSAGIFEWRMQRLVAVDGVPVRYGFMTDGRDTPVEVPAGTRRLVVHSSFNTGYGNTPREAYVLLVAPVASGKEYRLSGAVRDNQCSVWLEDLVTGEKVGAEGSETYRTVAPSPGMMPIFIPAKK